MIRAYKTMITRHWVRSMLIALKTYPDAPGLDRLLQGGEGTFLSELLSGSGRVETENRGERLSQARWRHRRNAFTSCHGRPFVLDGRLDVPEDRVAHADFDLRRECLRKYHGCRQRACFLADEEDGTVEIRPDAGGQESEQHAQDDRQRCHRRSRYLFEVMEPARGDHAD